MYLLTKAGRIEQWHDSADVWAGDVPPGHTVVEFNGAFPPYPDGVALPNAYLWDGAAPTLDPARPATQAERDDADQTVRFGQRGDRMMVLLRGIVKSVNARLPQAQQPITIAEILQRGKQ